jgi:hypothetical protein
MDKAELEGIAAHELEEWGRGTPVDLFELAKDNGFEIRFETPPKDAPKKRHRDRGRLVGNVIFVDPTLRPEKQRWDVGHELAHAFLYDARIPDTEDAVQYLTSCLLLPRLDYLRDIRQLGRNPWRLKERHPLASHEALARRIVALCEPCVLWVWDVQPAWNRYKVVSQNWRWPMRQPTALEVGAMREAESLGNEIPVEPIAGVVAWAVIDGPWMRLLCLSDGEALLNHFHTISH